MNKNRKTKENINTEKATTTKKLQGKQSKKGERAIDENKTNV